MSKKVIKNNPPKLASSKPPSTVHKKVCDIQTVHKDYGLSYWEGYKEGFEKAKDDILPAWAAFLIGLVFSAVVCVFLK